MVIVILLLLLATWSAVATVVAVHRDGYRRQPTDWRLVAEHEPFDRAESGHGYR